MLSKQDLLRYILMKFWKKKNIDSYQIKYEENGTYEPYTYTGHVTYVYLMKGLARIKKKPIANIDKRNYVIVIFAAF